MRANFQIQLHGVRLLDSYKDHYNDYHEDPCNSSMIYLEMYRCFEVSMISLGMKIRNIIF